MRSLSIILFLSMSCARALIAQNDDYVGDWEGIFENPGTFNVKVEIVILKDDQAELTFSNHKELFTESISLADKSTTENQIVQGLFFQFEFYPDSSAISAFIRSGMLLYHIRLERVSQNYFVGAWNMLMVDTLQTSKVYLSVEQLSGDDLAIYPVFGDQRFTGTWCADFKRVGDTVSFQDYKTGLIFDGILEPDSIIINYKIAEYLLASVVFKKSEERWNSGNSKSEMVFAENRNLQRLERAILADSLPNTHSILISRKGEIVYEQYFEGYHAGVPHDMRSASKSISSAITGLALGQNIIESTDQFFYQFLPEKYQNLTDSAKKKITLHHLLTMSAGMDAVDFGTDRISLASEDSYQRSADWLATVLIAPMMNDPGLKANYGSANPFLLGVVLDTVVSGNLELYMDRLLFRPLRIHDYIIQTDLTGSPYFAGGMYMRPGDMLKFGDLYLFNGVFDNKQILSESWVSSSFKKYFELSNTKDLNPYGYLWWHHAYEIDGQMIGTLEARGAGGQYIFIIPELKSTVVITSGNYKNGKTQQPEIILEKYILPYLLD